MTEHGAYAPDLVPEFVIDGHVHIWDLERARYPWLTPEIGELHRSVKFDEIAPTLSRLGIDAAILVQASDEADDTEVMLAAAEGSPSIVGVVAWSPLDTPDEMERTLARFDAIPSVVGIRNLIHERPREWVWRPQVEESLGILAAHRLPLDVPTADHRALPDVAWMGEKAPQLTLVIDHLGKPPINGTAEEKREWRAMLADCAQNPLTVAKVSGLYAMTGPMDGWTADGVRPFVDDALELFGADRLLYGGDWPISTLAGGYERTWTAISEMLSGLSDVDKRAVLSGTAMRVYLSRPSRTYEHNEVSQ